MSKQIDWDQPLSDFDRQYALDRGMQDKIKENDERFGGQPAERTRQQVEDELAEARQRVAELEVEVMSFSNRNVAAPPPAHGTFPPTQGTAVVGPTDNTSVDGEVPEGASEDQPDEYEAWTKADLIDEIEERNEKNGSNLSTSGTKAELIDRLRADDEARSEQ